MLSKKETKKAKCVWDPLSIPRHPHHFFISKKALFARKALFYKSGIWRLFQHFFHFLSSRRLNQQHRRRHVPVSGRLESGGASEGDFRRARRRFLRHVRSGGQPIATLSHPSGNFSNPISGLIVEHYIRLPVRTPKDSFVLDVSFKKLFCFGKALSRKRKINFR